MTLSEQVAKLEKELAERTAERLVCYEEMCAMRGEVKEAEARCSHAEMMLLNANACILQRQEELKEQRAESDEAIKLRTLLEARNKEVNYLREAIRTVLGAVRDIPYRQV